VWDPSIREANMSKQCTSDAASTMITSIQTLLESSQNSYSPQVEFWHDYDSFPQWNERVQQSLLRSLLLIYHDSNEILVQMSDIPSHYVQKLYDPFILPIISLDRFLKLILPLRTLYACKWMERMWVTLEYSLSKSACLMDQSNRV
jgi:hypothetical protein